MILKLVLTDVLYCANCKAWVARVPKWRGEEAGKGFCEKCGNTSVEIRDGRPFGPRSSKWPLLVEEFNEIYPFWSQTIADRQWFLSTVEVRFESFEAEC